MNAVLKKVGRSIVADLFVLKLGTVWDQEKVWVC